MSKKYPTGPEHLRMQRKKEIVKKRLRDAKEQLRWYDANPDHLKTLAYRQQAIDAAEVKLAFETHKQAHRQRLTEKRLTVSMQAFAACFRLSPGHDSGLAPTHLRARLEKTGPALSKKGKWKAYAMGTTYSAASVVKHLMSEKPKPRRNTIPADLPRVTLTVKLTHDFDKLEAVPLKVEHYPPLAAFETGAGYVAIFIQRSGEIIETAQTFEAALKKLQRPVKQIKIDTLIWNTKPGAL